MQVGIGFLKVFRQESDILSERPHGTTPTIIHGALRKVMTLCSEIPVTQNQRMLPTAYVGTQNMRMVVGAVGHQQHSIPITGGNE